MKLQILTSLFNFKQFLKSVNLEIFLSLEFLIVKKLEFFIQKITLKK